MPGAFDHTREPFGGLAVPTRVAEEDARHAPPRRKPDLALQPSSTECAVRLLIAPLCKSAVRAHLRSLSSVVCCKRPAIKASKGAARDDGGIQAHDVAPASRAGDPRRTRYILMLERRCRAGFERPSSDSATGAVIHHASGRTEREAAARSSNRHHRFTHSATESESREPGYRRLPRGGRATGHHQHRRSSKQPSTGQSFPGYIRVERRTGTATVDLRGLGASRTLVLINVAG